ncbi:hypothetical protein CL616_02480 [archaeon]|nr:hypothetical protein [archaeon]|tara:strand:- start:935 stop:1144 length:210 start_codon:yes stop_codon:yes gene_type:complete
MDEYRDVVAGFRAKYDDPYLPQVGTEYEMDLARTCALTGLSREKLEGVEKKVIEGELFGREDLKALFFV